MKVIKRDWRLEDSPRFIKRELKDEVLERDNHKCIRCSSKSYLEIDHAIPVCMGGKAKFNNLQVLCRGCNMKKSARQWWGETLKEQGLNKCGSKYLLNLLYTRTGLKDF